MTEGSAGPQGQQARPGLTVADVISLTRVPLAAAFVALEAPGSRLVVLLLAAASDVLDGITARVRGGSRWGAVLDPLADKVFVATAVAVVTLDGALTWWEAVLVLSRDIGAALAFAVSWAFRAPRVIRARWLGKIVTACQFLMLLAFVTIPDWLRPAAWVTAAVAALAVWDYRRVAGRAALSLRR